MKPWDEVIRIALKNDQASVCPGALERKARILKTPEEALGALRDFGGTGWVCATDERTVRRFAPETPLGQLPEGTWPLCGEAVHHLCLGGDGSMVGARHPAGILPLHARTAHQYILDGVVEHVAHMQHTRDVGGRDDDGIGFPFIRLGVE